MVPYQEREGVLACTISAESGGMREISAGDVVTEAAASSRKERLFMVLMLATPLPQRVNSLDAFPSTCARGSRRLRQCPVPLARHRAHPAARFSFRLGRSEYQSRARSCPFSGRQQ